MTESSYNFPVIGIMHSCYKAKFGVPRQPGLISGANGFIELVPPYNQPNTLRGLEDFSHIWVLFVFHHNLREGWKATVRPPRLGGDKRIGVFASRSPFRPSPVGLSVLEMTGIEQKEHGILRIHVRGQDIVDGTPIVDIKPYIPYTDSLPQAKGGFASTAPNAEAINVMVSTEAENDFAFIESHGHSGFRKLATDVIAADPRPAYQREPGRIYGVFLEDFEVVWKIDGPNAVITEVKKAEPLS